MAVFDLQKKISTVFFSQFLAIKTLNPDPYRLPISTEMLDPDPHSVNLDVLFWGLKVWTTFMEAQEEVNCNFWSKDLKKFNYFFPQFLPLKPWIRIHIGFQIHLIWWIRIRVHNTGQYPRDKQLEMQRTALWHDLQAGGQVLHGEVGEAQCRALFSQQRVTGQRRKRSM